MTGNTAAQLPAQTTQRVKDIAQIAETMQLRKWCVLQAVDTMKAFSNFESEDVERLTNFFYDFVIEKLPKQE